LSEQDIEKLIENYNKAQTENATLQTEITTLKEEMALM
jgi:cell division protein FtsB